MTRFALILLLACAAPVAAQAAGQGKNGDQSAIEHRPPPGMCRIWIDGVPAERQPAPTDCATAIRRRPSNARVIFGDEVRSRVPTQHLLAPRPNDAQPNEPKTNDPKANAPRSVDPNTEPRPAQPRVQPPPPRPPVRMPPRPVAKPHKPSGPPMSRIRIH